MNDNQLNDSNERSFQHRSLIFKITSHSFEARILFYNLAVLFGLLTEWIPAFQKKKNLKIN